MNTNYIALIFSLLAAIVTPVHADSDIDELNKQMNCMALNIYHEARGENSAGMYAVADVVLNRVVDSRYPSTVCKVVKQSITKNNKPVKNKCQFSWYCDGASDTPKNPEAWIKATEIAYLIIIEHKFRGITDGSTHYHTNQVNPRWNSEMQLVGRIGSHLFFRWN